MPIGRLYTIRSHINPELIYVGSTTQALSARMSGHRADFRRWQVGEPSSYITSFQIIALGDAYIELAEMVEFNTTEELRAAEGKMIRNTNCVNKVIAGQVRDKEFLKNDYANHRVERIKESRAYNVAHKDDVREYQREHYALNKDKQLKQMKAYREENKEKIKDYMSREVTCECGLKMKYSAKYAHVKKEVHKQRMIQLTASAVEV